MELDTFWYRHVSYVGTKSIDTWIKRVILTCKLPDNRYLSLAVEVPTYFEGLSTDSFQRQLNFATRSLYREFIRQGGLL